MDVSEGVAFIVCCLQPIKIKLRQNQVESAIMCQIKTEHNVGLVRVEAMHKRTPVFTFMFGRDGNLLNSNPAAMTKFGVKRAGRASTYATLQANPAVLLWSIGCGGDQPTNRRHHCCVAVDHALCALLCSALLCWVNVCMHVSQQCLCLHAGLLTIVCYDIAAACDAVCIDKHIAACSVIHSWRAHVLRHMQTQILCTCR